MEYATSHDRGEIVDLILSNTIYPAPNESETDQLYRIGEGEAFITIQSNKKRIISAYCIRHNKYTGTRYIKFDNSAEAAFVSGACKLRLEGQNKELEKIEKFCQKHEEIIKSSKNANNQR